MACWWFRCTAINARQTRIRDSRHESVIRARTPIDHHENLSGSKIDVKTQMRVKTQKRAREIGLTNSIRHVPVSKHYSILAPVWSYRLKFMHNFCSCDQNVFFLNPFHVCKECCGNKSSTDPQLLSIPPPPPSRLFSRLFARYGSIAMWRDVKYLSQHKRATTDFDCFNGTCNTKKASILNHDLHMINSCFKRNMRQFSLQMFCGVFSRLP